MSLIWRQRGKRKPVGPQQRAAIGACTMGARLEMPTDRRSASLLYCDQRNAVDEAVGQQKVAIARDGGVAHDVSAARDRPALEFFGFGIEAHDGVGGRSGLAVPDDIV